MLELRIYTLVSTPAMSTYTTEFWPRHAESLLAFGIVVRGVWADVGTDARRVLAIVEYPPDEDPGEVADRYRRSPAFASDPAHFDASLIASTETRRVDSVLDRPAQRAGRYSR